MAETPRRTAKAKAWAAALVKHGFLGIWQGASWAAALLVGIVVWKGHDDVLDILIADAHVPFWLLIVTVALAAAAPFVFQWFVHRRPPLALHREPANAQISLEHVALDIAGVGPSTSAVVVEVAD